MASIYPIYKAHHNFSYSKSTARSAEPEDVKLYGKLIKYFIERYINQNNPQHILTTLGNEIILLLHTKDTSYALGIINDLKEKLSSQFGINNAAGIGCVSQNASEIKLSYDAAKFAFKASESTADKTSLVFSHNAELLISSVN